VRPIVGRIPPTRGRPTLTLDRDAYDAASGDARHDGSTSPGLGEAITGVREQLSRLISAHLALLRAELAVLGRELGIIVGLGVAALGLAVLMLILLVVGGLLFLGEWWFGSMGWGIIHGTLLFVALITGIGLNLAGGWTGAYTRGLVVGVLVTVLGSILFASNVLREGAVWAGRELEPIVPLEPALLPTLVGLVVGAIVVGILMLIVARATDVPWPGMLAAGLVIGAVIGAILGSVTFDIQGAVAVSLMLGLLAWPVSAGGLAARRGFDPQGRYAALVPDASISAAKETGEYLKSEWRRQLKRMVGR
jgi:hypothetical protein